MAEGMSEADGAEIKADGEGAAHVASTPAPVNPAPVTTAAPEAAPVENFMEKLGIKKAEFEVKSGELDKAASEFNSARSNAEPVIKTLKEHEAFAEAHDKLAEIAKFDEKTKGWKPNAGVDKAKFEEGLTAFEEAKDKLHSAVFFDETENASLKSLREARGKLAPFTNPLWGKVKAVGVGETLKDNLPFFKKGGFKGRGIEMSARGAGLGASLYCGYEAIRNQDAEGNEKSTGDRLLWLAGALGIAGAAVMAGAAR